MPVVRTQAPPAEMTNTPVTDKYFSDLKTQYSEYTEQCTVELAEMNQNVISNIVARGGDAGWEHVGTNDCLLKDFEFQSFEQADAFVQAVGLRADAIDHHPEWSVSNGGRTVQVRLTSHFADNKVTRLDFELAEICNEEFSKNVSTYSMFPRFSAQQWATFKIGFFCFAVGVFTLRILTGPDHATHPQSYIPVTETLEDRIYVREANRALILESEKEAIAAQNIQEHALRHVVTQRVLL